MAHCDQQRGEPLRLGEQVGEGGGITAGMSIKIAEIIGTSWGKKRCEKIYSSKTRNYGERKRCQCLSALPYIPVLRGGDCQR